jgi:hypothetical protein
LVVRGVVVLGWMALSGLAADVPTRVVAIALTLTRFPRFDALLSTGRRAS